MDPVPIRNRVLVVDDEEFIGQLVAEALTDEGYEVRRAQHGGEALEIMRSWLPHLILLDLMMPVMDGWSFRTAQRQLDAEAAAVPVVILSGARETRARAAELAAADALGKPFNVEDVVAAVARWIRPHTRS